MKKFGSERIRNVVLTACVPHLVAAGLIVQDDDTKKITRVLCIGDRFHYGDYKYDVLSVAKGNTFGNTDIALDFNMRAELYREVSTEYSGI